MLALVEDGRIGLDDPIGTHIPELASLQVLRPGATRLDNTEPARRPITVRHLLSHSAGLSYGLLDPGTLMYRAYTERRVLGDGRSLAELVRILDPLGMQDTSFVIPESERSRLAALYVGVDLLDPTQPGLRRMDDTPYPGAYMKPMPRQSGGGGLVSSLGDMTALMRALVPGGPTLLRPETLEAMRVDQLADGVCVGFPMTGPVRGKGHGLAGAVTRSPSPLDPPGSTGAMQWGGMAGTHWWISPDQGLAAVLMTQRYMGFWNPYWFEFMKRVCAAA